MTLPIKRHKAAWGDLLSYLVLSFQRSSHIFCRSQYEKGGQILRNKRPHVQSWQHLCVLCKTLRRTEGNLGEPPLFIIRSSCRQRSRYSGDSPSSPPPLTTHIHEIPMWYMPLVSLCDQVPAVTSMLDLNRWSACVYRLEDCPYPRISR